MYHSALGFSHKHESRKGGIGQEFRKVLLMYSCMLCGWQVLNASKAHACYCTSPVRLHVATCSSSAAGSRPGLRHSSEALVNILRNVFTLGQKKVSYKSFSGDLKKHKQNMCLQYNCTIALLEEQDVLQDFSLSFAHKSCGQTSAQPQSSKKQQLFPLITNSL